jgi:hypothetical protein
MHAKNVPIEYFMKIDEGLREEILYCPNLRQPLSDSGQFRAAKFPVLVGLPANLLISIYS